MPASKKNSRKAPARKSRGAKNPGTGAFKRCVAAVSAKGTAFSPGGVCATAGVKKYGKKKFQQMAAAGRKRAAKRGNAGKRRRGNPEEAAAERYEYFHGHPPKTTTVIKTSEHRHSVTSGIGKLHSMKIAVVTGGKVVTLGNFKGTMLSQDDNRKPGKQQQLFIKGGDQAVNLGDFGIARPHEHEVLGALTEIAYDTNKTHLTPETGGDAIYRHPFGKGGKRLPLIVYDVRNKLLHVVGGEYSLPATGIKG